MKYARAPRMVLCGMLCTPLSLLAQTLDWGIWDGNGNANYGNGDTIAITSLVNGSAEATNGENNLLHRIVDASFPLPNAPENNEFGFFRNESATSGEWSILIDLSDFTFTTNTVIGFSNLDGISFQTLEPGHSTVEFRDSADNPISISTASFIGAYDTYFQGIRWDAESAFDLNSGRWDVVTDSGTSSDPYLRNVGGAFFLTNLPETIDHIVLTKSAPTNYLYDSMLFYAANPVPEPETSLCLALSMMSLWRRRR